MMAAATSAPVKKKLIVRRGITLSELVFVADGLTEPVDLDGYDARMQIRSDFGGEIVADLSLGEGISIHRNRVEINIPAAQTESFLPGSYKYDLEIESPDGTVFQLSYGSVSVKDSITM